MQPAGWEPGDVVGLGSERLGGRLTATQDRNCRTVQHGQTVGQAGTTRGVPVLVPPAVFEKEVAIFDLPMIADMGQQLLGRDLRRIEAGQKVTTIMRYDIAIGGQYVAIDAQADPTAGEAQLLADIIGVVQAQPESAAI